MIFSRIFLFRTLSKDPNMATSLFFCLLLPAVIVPMMVAAPTPKAKSFLLLSLAVAMALPVLFPIMHFDRAQFLREWSHQGDHGTGEQPWHDLWSQLHQVAEAYFFTWSCLFVLLMFLVNAPNFVLQSMLRQVGVAIIILWTSTEWLFVIDKLFRRNAWVFAVGIWNCMAFLTLVLFGVVNLSYCSRYPGPALRLLFEPHWVILFVLFCFINVFLMLPAQWYLRRSVYRK